MQEEEEEAKVCERERGQPRQQKEPRATEQGGGKEKGRGRPAETKGDRTKSKNSHSIPKLLPSALSTGPRMSFFCFPQHRSCLTSGRLNVLRALMKCADLKDGSGNIKKSHRLMGRKQKHSLGGRVCGHSKQILWRWMTGFYTESFLQGCFLYSIPTKEMCLIMHICLSSEIMKMDINLIKYRASRHDWLRLTQRLESWMKS